VGCRHALQHAPGSDHQGADRAGGVPVLPEALGGRAGGGASTRQGPNRPCPVPHAQTQTQLSSARTHASTVARPRPTSIGSALRRWHRVRAVTNNAVIGTLNSNFGTLNAIIGTLNAIIGTLNNVRAITIAVCKTDRRRLTRIEIGPATFVLAASAYSFVRCSGGTRFGLLQKYAQT
jgi:hypothetical protein